MFSCEFSKISKNTFFTEHLWTTASGFTENTHANISSFVVSNLVSAVFCLRNLFRSFVLWIIALLSSLFTNLE